MVGSIFTPCQAETGLGLEEPSCATTLPSTLATGSITETLLPGEEAVIGKPEGALRYQTML